MKKLSIKKIGKAKVNPIFSDLPDTLKDVKQYYRIEEKLAKILESDHKHETVKEYATCAWCNQKRELRQNTIKAEGFTSITQYLEWKKVMSIIHNKQNICLK